MTMIETGQRLSKAAFWTEQKQFYLKNGIKIWSDRPAYMASVSSFVDATARLVVAFVMEQSEWFVSVGCIPIVELGTGSGCFTYRFLQSLTTRLSQVERLQNIPLRYVMTDIIPEIMDVWKNNERLQPFFVNETLNCALFDPEQQLQLHEVPEQLANCLSLGPIVIANSLFDTIAIDGFKFSNGNIFEVVGDVNVAEGENISEALLNSSIKIEEKQGKRVSLPYYQDTHLNNLLAEYASELPSATISIPVAGLNILSNLLDLTSEKITLIVSSRGFSDPTYFREDDQLGYKDLCFPLNFDAIARFARQRSGRSILSRRSGVSHKLGLFSFGMIDDLSFTETTYRDAFETRNNTDTYIDLACSLDNTTFESDADLHDCVIAVMRLSCYDPEIFWRFASKHFDQLETALLNLPLSKSDSVREVLTEINSRIFSFDRPLEPFDSTEPDLLSMLIQTWKRTKNSSALKPLFKR